MTPDIQRIIKGKKFIGQGGTRAVYDLEDCCIIKIAKSQKGILCNKMEVILYTTSSTTLRKYLAPILDYDKKYRWIVMRKYIRRFPLDSSIYKKAV